MKVKIELKERDWMTYRKYLECCDEFEKTVIAVNLIRNHPHLEQLTSTARKKAIKELLDTEMPTEKESEGEE